MSLIRHAVTDDARAVAKIHVDAWRAAYSAILPKAFLASLTVASRQAFWTQFLADKPGDLLVSMAGDCMLGWINTGPCRDQDAATNDAEIWALYASPTIWSTGVGRQLWMSARSRLLEQGHLHCRLWVLAQNPRAIRFIKLPGFRRTMALKRPLNLAVRWWRKFGCPAVWWFRRGPGVLETGLFKRT